MTIAVVGTPQAGAAADGADVTLTFAGGSPAQGDLVLVVGGHFTRAATNYGPSTAGYSLISLVQPNNASIGAWWKIMGVSPDTSVVCQGSANVADAAAYACITLHGVDQVTPFDTAAPAGGNSTNPDPGSVTPTLTTDLIIAAAVSIVDDATPGTQANYTQQANASVTDTNPASVALSSRQVASASAEDPPAWSTWATGNWATLTIAVRTAAPFLSRDYPNPTPPRVAVTNNTFLNAVDIQLIGKDKFFGGFGQTKTYDYPNPRGAAFPSDLRTFLNPTKTQLIGKDKFFGGFGQGPAYDWPNPLPPKYPSDNRTFVNPAETQLIGKDKFFGAAGQGPANLDWPVPKAPLYPITLRSWLDEMRVTLRGQDTFFGDPGQAPANLDWPVPKGYPLGTINNRSHLDTFKLELIGQDRFFGAAGQGPANLDWPVPKGPIYTISLRTWLDPTKLTLRGQDTFFGDPGQAPANLDWPNPRGYPIGTIANRNHLDTFKLELIGQDQFFGAPGQGPANLDWPVPKGYQLGAVTGRTHLDSFKLQLIGQDQFFGAPGQAPIYDWPNPTSRKVSQQEAPPNLLTALLGIILFPFAQYLWPNPPGKENPVAGRTHLNAAQTQLIGQDQFFGALGQVATFDWPNPAQRKDDVAQRSWLGNLLQTTLSIVLAPFSFLDWRNPPSARPMAVSSDQPPNLVIQTSHTPWSGFVANMGRMMGRRG